MALSLTPSLHTQRMALAWPHPNMRAGMICMNGHVNKSHSRRGFMKRETKKGHNWGRVKNFIILSISFPSISLWHTRVCMNLLPLIKKNYVLRQFYDHFFYCLYYKYDRSLQDFIWFSLRRFSSWSLLPDLNSFADFSTYSKTLVECLLEQRMWIKADIVPHLSRWILI